MKGSEFAEALPADRGPDRDAAVLEAVRSNAVVPTLWRAIHSSIPGHTATIYVGADALAVGEPGDFLRLEVTAVVAQQIDDLLGTVFSTAKIEDLIWLQAEIRLDPELMSFGPEMTTTHQSVAYNRKIDEALVGRVGLISTLGKQWILSNKLIRHPAGIHGAINYGWHSSRPVGEHGPFNTVHGVRLWQDVGTRHNDAHVDESQIKRLVRADCIVDGKPMQLVDVMRSRELAGLVSYEGPLLVTRQTSVPAPPPPAVEEEGGEPAPCTQPSGAGAAT